MTSNDLDLRQNDLVPGDDFESCFNEWIPSLADAENQNALWRQKLSQVFASIALPIPAPADYNDLPGQGKVWRGVDGMPLTEEEYLREQQELENARKSLKRARDEVAPEDTVTPVIKKVRKDAVDSANASPATGVDEPPQQANTSNITNPHITTLDVDTSLLEKSPSHAILHGDSNASNQQSSNEKYPTIINTRKGDIFATQLKMANAFSNDGTPYHQEPLQPIDHLSQEEIDGFFEDNDAIADIPRLAGDTEEAASPAAASPAASPSSPPATPRIDMSTVPMIMRLPQRILAQIMDNLGWDTLGHLTMMSTIFMHAAFDSAAYKCQRSHEDGPVPPPLPEKEVVEIEDDEEEDEAEEEEVAPVEESEPFVPSIPETILTAVPEQHPAAMSAQQPSTAQMPTMDATIAPGQYLANQTVSGPIQVSAVPLATPYYPAAVPMQQPTPVRAPQATGPSMPVLKNQNALMQQSAVQPSLSHQREHYGVLNGTSTITAHQPSAAPMPSIQHMSNPMRRPSVPPMAAQQLMAPGAQHHPGSMNQYPQNVQQFFVPGVATSHPGVGQEPLTPASFTQAMHRAPSAGSSTPVSPAVAGRKRKHTDASPSRVNPDTMNGMGTPYAPFFPSPVASSPATPNKCQRVQQTQPGRVQTPTRMSATPGPSVVYTPGGHPAISPGAYGGMTPGYHNAMQTSQMHVAQIHSPQSHPNVHVQTRMHPQVRAGTPAGQPPRAVYTPQPHQTMGRGMQQMRASTPQATGQRPPMSREQMMAQQMASREAYAQRQAAANAMLQRNLGRQTLQNGMAYGGRNPAQMQHLAQMHGGWHPPIPVGVQMQMQMNGVAASQHMQHQRPMQGPGMAPSHLTQNQQRPPQGLGLGIEMGMGTVPPQPMQDQQSAGTGRQQAEMMPPDWLEDLDFLGADSNGSGWSGL